MNLLNCGKNLVKITLTSLLSCLVVMNVLAVDPDAKFYREAPAVVKNDNTVKAFYKPYCKKQPTVVEFFSYACPGCFSAEKHFDQYLSSKPDNIVFKRVPVIFNRGWDLVAKMYYGYEKLGVTKEFHGRTFQWVQNQLRNRKPVDNASIEQFLKDTLADDSIAAATKSKFSISDFMDVINSTTINRDNMNGMRLFSAYKISSTPSVVVNNKYVITLDKAKNLENVIKTIEKLTNEDTSC